MGRAPCRGGRAANRPRIRHRRHPSNNSGVVSRCSSPVVVVMIAVVKIPRRVRVHHQPRQRWQTVVGHQQRAPTRCSGETVLSGGVQSVIIIARRVSDGDAAVVRCPCRMEGDLGGRNSPSDSAVVVRRRVRCCCCFCCENAVEVSDQIVAALAVRTFTKVNRAVNVAVEASKRRHPPTSSSSSGGCSGCCCCCEAISNSHSRRGGTNRRRGAAVGTARRRRSRRPAHCVAITTRSLRGVNAAITTANANAITTVAAGRSSCIAVAVAAAAATSHVAHEGRRRPSAAAVSVVAPTEGRGGGGPRRRGGHQCVQHERAVGAIEGLAVPTVRLKLGNRREPPLRKTQTAAAKDTTTVIAAARWNNDTDPEEVPSSERTIVAVRVAAAICGVERRVCCRRWRSGSIGGPHHCCRHSPSCTASVGKEGRGGGRGQRVKRTSTPSGLANGAAIGRGVRHPNIRGCRCASAVTIRIHIASAGGAVMLSTASGGAGEATCHEH